MFEQFGEVVKSAAVIAPPPVSTIPPVAAMTVTLPAILMGAALFTLSPASSFSPPEPVFAMVELTKIEPAASRVNVADEFHKMSLLTAMSPASPPVMPVVIVTLVPAFNSLTISALVTVAPVAIGV